MTVRNGWIVEGGALCRFVWSHPETKKERYRALSRLIAWQFWQRAVGRPWTVRLAGGLKMKCYPHSTAAAAVLYTRYPEWEEMHFTEDLLEAGDWFVDVGANVGVYSLLAAAIKDVRVFAIEPSAEAADRAEENIALNQIDARVKVLRVAAGSTPRSGRLTSGLGTMNRLLEAGEQGEASTVEVAPLDDLLPSDAARKVALIKIDVEGAELEVLRGARRLLEAPVPAWIVEANDPDGLARLFASYGYTPRSYDPVARRLVSCRHQGNNLIFAHTGSGAALRLGRLFVPGEDDAAPRDGRRG